MKTIFSNRSLECLFNIKSVFFLLLCFLGLSVIFQDYSQADKVLSTEEKRSDDVEVEKTAPIDDEEDDDNDASPIPTSDLTGAGAPEPVIDSFNPNDSKQMNANKLITFAKEISGDDVDAGSDAAFGGAITTIADRDGNGIDELVVGAFNADDSNGGNPGVVFVIFLDRNGEILDFHRITSNEGGFVGELPDDASFGHTLTNGGDINGDGTDDLLVGAPDHIHENNPDKEVGRFFVLFLDKKGLVTGQKKIGGKDDGWPESFNSDGDELGHTVGIIPRINGETYHSVGVPGDDDGGKDAGSVYILKLKPDGKVRASQKISRKIIGSKIIAKKGDRFGDAGTSSILDIDGDGIPDIAAGASGADIGNGANEGKFWIINLLENGSVKNFTEVSDLTQDILANETEPGDFFGHGEFRTGSFKDNAILGVGAFGDDDGVTNAGALYLLLLNKKGNVEGKLKLSTLLPDFPINLLENDWFGFAAAKLGSFGNGTAIAVGAPGNVAIPELEKPGKVFLLFLNGIQQ